MNSFGVVDVEVGHGLRPEAPGVDSAVAASDGCLGMEVGGTPENFNQITNQYIERVELAA